MIYSAIICITYIITRISFHLAYLFCAMALSNCCCCVNLRTGAIIIAVLGLLASFGNFQNGLVVGILTLVGGIVANLCLLHGAIKYNRTTTLVYLVMEAIFIILYIVGLIFIIIGLTNSSVKECMSGDNWDTVIAYKDSPVTCSVIVGILIALLVAFIIGIAISIYFWVCVYSFFDDLKRQQFHPYQLHHRQ